MSTPKIPATSPRDNLIGICHALGEIFGFNPLFLRIALLIVVMINAEAALIAYFGAGVAVLTAKLVTPSGRKNAVRAKALIHT